MRNAYKKIRKFASELLNKIYPDKCFACGELLNKNEKYLCEICSRKYEIAKSVLRQTYHGVPSVELVSDEFPDEAVLLLTSLTDYSQHSLESEFVVQKRIMYTLKRSNTSKLVDFLFDEYTSMIYRVLEKHLDKNTFFITSIPRNGKNLKSSGVDNMRSVGKKIANHFGMEYIAALTQRGNVKEQKRLNRSERSKNVSGKIVLSKVGLRYAEFENVILIDDMVTTGASIKEAAKVLMNLCGVKHVYAFSFAQSTQGILNKLS